MRPGVMKRVADWRRPVYEKLLVKAGREGYPASMAARAVSRSALSALVVVPAGIAGSLLIWVPIALCCLAPIVIFFVPEALLRDAAAQRRERVEAELPFFSILANVLGTAGVPLYSVFETLAKSDIFEAMRKEALVIRREVEVFGNNPTFAFEVVAAYHPSRKFGYYLLGYSSKVRSGGDAPAYLSGESGSLLRELEERWVRYSARVGVVGSLMVTIFGVIPLMLLVVGFFSPASSISVLTVFAFVGVPFLATALVFMTGRMQPVGDVPLEGRPMEATVLFFSAAAGGWYLHLGWLALAVALSVSFGFYGLSVRKQLARMKQVDSSLPMLLKDLMDYKRQEYDLGRSLAVISSEGSYGRALDSVVRSVAAQLRAGVPLSEAVVDPGTRLSRVVFSVLAKMGYSGGGTVDTLFQLTQYATKVTEMKRSAEAEMKPYLLLSYLTPLLLVFGVTFVGGILSSFQSPLLGLPGHTGQSSAGLGGLVEIADGLIVTSAAALGIVGAKIADLTVKNTNRAMVNVILAASAAALAPSINLTALLHGGL
ncbi:MAG: type II secretion system F family protein [archaeon]|nr:MAG: type II secretion system F family protein [archaeon]